MFVNIVFRYPTHQRPNPALASRLQSDALGGRVAELGSLDGTTRMKLPTHMIIGWLAIFAGGVTFAFDASPWFFIGALLLSHFLRTRFEPRIPGEVERRRWWIFLLFAPFYLGFGLWLDVRESGTHPFNVSGAILITAVVAWHIFDDIRIYRQLH